MIFIILFVASFFSCGFGMDLICRFEPSKAAQELKVIAANRTHNESSELKSKQIYLFNMIMDAESTNHISVLALKALLEDELLVEATVAFKPAYERNEFIEFLFFGSILYKKNNIVRFFLEKKIVLEKMRSSYSESPAEFARRNQNIDALIMFRSNPHSIVRKKS